MGRKRKYKDRDNSEYLMKKLTRELRKRRRRSYSSSHTSSKCDSEVEEYNRYYEYTDIESDKDYEPEPPKTQVQNTLQPEATTNDLTPQPSTSTTAVTISNNDEELQKESEPLDDEILTLLGDAPKDTSPVGKDVHADIATRLQDILKNGLKKEDKTKILEEYPIPGNCQLFIAPILNAEIKAAVSDLLQKKDTSLAARQGQIGVALSALASAMNILVTEKSTDNQIVLRHVSNACRLLCDSHNIDTRLRRNFLVSTLNSTLKDTLKESKRDKHLFGESLSEKLKANKAISQTSQYLKPNVNKPRLSTNRLTNTTNNLNWKNPQPNYQNSNRKLPSMVHRTAGSSSTAHRNEVTTRKPTASRANRPRPAQYRNQKKY